MAMEWKNEDTLLFLELYHDEKVVWNPSYEKRKGRNKLKFIGDVLFFLYVFPSYNTFYVLGFLNFLLDVYRYFK